MTTPKKDWIKKRAGLYESPDGNWQIERDYNRETTTSSQRNWILVDISNGRYKQLKAGFRTMDKAINQAERLTYAMG